MTRIRSPGYPSCSLSQALEYVEKIFSKVRRNPIDREAAVREAGYSGLTGASAKMLSNMAHFNLIENSGKGMIRVSDIAVRILHPTNEHERKSALYEAAFSPELFGRIQQNYPDGYVSENALKSLLKREGFAEAAVAPALRSYIDTYSYLQQSGATESHRLDGGGHTESSPSPNDQETPSMVHASVIPAVTHTNQIQSVEALILNEPNLSIRGGDTVKIEALLDYDGLEQLEKKITALKMLLKQKPQ